MSFSSADLLQDSIGWLTVFQCPVDGLKQASLLGIHSVGLLWRDTKEWCVKYTQVLFKEMAILCVELLESVSLLHPNKTNENIRVQIFRGRDGKMHPH